jgi:hypothetical protein
MKRFFLALVFALAAAAHAAERQPLRARAMAPDLQGLQKAVASLRAQASKPPKWKSSSFPMLPSAFASIGSRSSGTVRKRSSGKSKGDANSSAVAVVRLGVVAANIRDEGRLFQIRYRGGGVHEARESDPAVPRGATDRRHLRHQPRPRPPPAAIPAASMTDDGSIIDVMVLYTPAARIGASPDDPDNPAAILSEINLAVADTNAAYERSLVTQRLRLVHVAEVDYADTGDAKNTDFPRLINPSDGYLDEAHALRNTYGADVVSLGWRTAAADSSKPGDGPSSWIRSPLRSRRRPSASSSVSTRTTPTPSPTSSGGTWACGGTSPWIRRRRRIPTPTATWTPTHLFRTIMGLRTACFSRGGRGLPPHSLLLESRRPVQRIPDRQFDGQRSARAHQTASTRRELPRDRAASRRASSFSPTAYTVNEFGGSVTLSVVRTPRQFRTVSVQYSTVNGTGRDRDAGSDYTATDGNTLVGER